MKRHILGLVCLAFLDVGDSAALDFQNVGWGVLGGHGESGTTLALNYQVETALGDGPFLLETDLSNFAFMLRDDYSFANIFALPALAATLVGLHPSNVRSGFLRFVGYALILPEAISNSAVGIQNEKRQRLTIGMDTALYTWTDVDTEAAFGKRFLLGMQFRPHLGLKLPLGDRHGIFVSGGYNYDWSWQKTSDWIGWDVQAGIRFGARDSTRRFSQRESSIVLDQFNTTISSSGPSGSPCVIMRNRSSS